MFFNLPIIGTWIAKQAVGHILTKKPDLKSIIVNAVNAKVDIPRLNEAQEEQLFKAIFDSLIAFLKN